MLKRNLKSVSPGDQGIFAQTEIAFASDKTTRVSLPRIASVPAALSIPSALTARPAVSQSQTKPSARKTPSLTPIKRPAERVSKSQRRLSFERLDQVIQNEFLAEQENPKVFTDRLRSIEASRHVVGEVKLATEVVKSSLARFNELHRISQAKEAQLRELLQLLESLAPDEQAARQREEAMLQLEAELEETLQGLRNETHYQETLEGMLESRKISLRERKKPITYLRTDISQVNNELALVKKDMHKAEKVRGEATRELGELQEALLNQRAEHHSQVKSEVDQYKDKQKLLLFLKQEQENSAQTRRQIQLRARLGELEKKHAFLKDYEKDMEVAKSIEQHRIQEERKFKEIQSTTNITSIMDMEPYWKYLTENRERLERAVSSAEQQIAELTHEREDAKAELKEMYVDADDSFLSLGEIAFMEERLKQKIEELDNNEANLHRMEDLLAGVTNSVSLIAYALLPEDKALEVKPSTSVDFLLQCARELEEILSAGDTPKLQEPPRSRGVSGDE